MFRRKKRDVEMAQAKDADEAMNFMFAGIKYFLIHNWFRTGIVILLIAGGTLYTVIDVYQNIMRSKARIEHNIK
jgi:hypothetical protein